MIGDLLLLVETLHTIQTSTNHNKKVHLIHTFHPNPTLNMPRNDNNISIVPDPNLISNTTAPSEATRVGRRQIDWITIEAEYIHGSLKIDPESGLRTMHFPTNDELAGKYSVPIYSVRQRCTENKWVERRELYKQKIKRAIGQERVHSLMSESSRYDAKNLILLDRIYDQVERWLDAHEVEDYDDETGKPSINRNHMKDIDLAITILNKGHVLVRNIMGEPINAEKIVNELMQLQNDEQKQIQKQGKNTKKKINNLLKQVEDRQDILNNLMTKKRQIEGEIKDVMTLDVASTSENE